MPVKVPAAARLHRFTPPTRAVKVAQKTESHAPVRPRSCLSIGPRNTFWKHIRRHPHRGRPPPSARAYPAGGLGGRVSQHHALPMQISARGEPGVDRCHIRVVSTAPRPSHHTMRHTLDHTAEIVLSSDFNRGPAQSCRSLPYCRTLFQSRGKFSTV